MMERREEESGGWEKECKKRRKEEKSERRKGRRKREKERRVRTKVRMQAKIVKGGNREAERRNVGGGETNNGKQEADLKIVREENIKMLEKERRRRGEAGGKHDLDLKIVPEEK